MLYVYIGIAVLAAIGLSILAKLDQIVRRLDSIADYTGTMLKNSQKDDEDDTPWTSKGQ